MVATADHLIIGRDPKPFTLPLSLVTSTQAILARKRSGKSYTASVEAEELLAAGQQIGVVDPTGAWWGLRSSADGEGPGYPVVVFGGDHADAPLDFRAGKATASAFVDYGFSAIFDVSNLATDEQVMFVMDFSSELLRRNRSAVHIFMDEADTFAPQKPLGLLQNKCLGTVSRLVKQGGIRGVGFTMITQRPASMNKDALSQVDILTLLRMSHPLDLRAAYDWIASEVNPEFAAEVRGALPSLEVGTAFFCSASLSLGQRVQVRKRRTFNSGATPKPGEARAEPKVMAAIDIQKLGQEITASVERTRQESPEYLKQRIAELEQQIAKGGVADMGVLEDVQRMERELEELRPLREQVAALMEDVKQAALVSETAESFLRDILTRAEDAKRRISEMRQELFGNALDLFPSTYMPDAQAMAAVDAHRKSERETEAAATIEKLRIAQRELPAAAKVAEAHESINKPQQAILNAIATLHRLPNANVTLEWIACTAGTTARARGFEENWRQLKAKGLVSGIHLTAVGAALAQPDATPATFAAVLGRLATMLSNPQVEILRQLKLAVRTPAELAHVLGTTERARGFEENVRQLRKRELIVSDRGVLRLAGWLETLR